MVIFILPVGGNVAYPHYLFLTATNIARTDITIVPRAIIPKITAGSIGIDIEKAIKKRGFPI